MTPTGTLDTTNRMALNDEEREAVEAAERAASESPEERLGRQMAEQAERMGTDSDGAPIVPPEEIRVAGTQNKLFDFGGKQPSSAVITLAGGQYELLEGQGYEKGDVVTFTGTAVVFDVGARDKVDKKTGMVVSATQRHTARITDLVIRPAS